MTPSPNILRRINLMADSLEEIDKIDRREIIAALKWWVEVATWDELERNREARNDRG